jgi:hypothetical protein
VILHKNPSLSTEVNLAETRRFELLKGLTPYLVSSEAHSTGLCDVSLLQARVYRLFSISLNRVILAHERE